MKLFYEMCLLAAAVCAGPAWGQNNDAGGNATQPSQVLSPTVIGWKVEDRFRLWSGGGDAQRRDLDQLYNQLAGEPSVDVSHDAIVAFLRAHPDIWRHIPWDKSAEGYETSYVFPASYSVLIGLPVGSSPAGSTCSWQTTVGMFDVNSLSCASGVHLALPADHLTGSQTAHVTVAITGADGTASTLSADIHVKDRVIVSLGDSFASGEGNPDIPTNLGALAGGPAANASDPPDTWLGTATAGVKAAHWVEPVCHRSLFNQHLVVALKLAADRSHEAVTFMSYACSGASIFDGLLAPQAAPPGFNDSPSAEKPKFAQVEAMGRDLCLPTSMGPRYTQISAKYRRPTLKRHLLSSEYYGGTETVNTAAFQCPGDRRKPDGVLLSVGGNDVFFAPIIMGAMLPKALPDFLSNKVLQIARAQLARENYESVAAEAFILRPSLSILKSRLRAIAGSAPVIQSEYPPPTRDSTGNQCGPNTDPSKGEDVVVLRRLLAPKGIWVNVPGILHIGWSMSISVDDEDDLESQVVGGLGAILKTNAKRSHWVYVDRYSSDFATHGWCAGDGDNEQADLPLWNPVSMRWTNWDPSKKWDPYVRRSRYFRTPNDSALTEMQEDERQPDVIVVKQKQWILMNSLAGSFHPTFQGHVVMGLKVGSELQRQLPAE